MEIFARTLCWRIRQLRRGRLYDICDKIKHQEWKMAIYHLCPYGVSFDLVKAKYLRCHKDRITRMYAGITNEKWGREKWAP